MGLLIFPHESELEYIISLFNAIKTKVINLEQIFQSIPKKRKSDNFQSTSILNSIQAKRKPIDQCTPIVQARQCNIWFNKLLPQILQFFHLDFKGILQYWLLIKILDFKDIGTSKFTIAHSLWRPFLHQEGNYQLWKATLLCLKNQISYSFVPPGMEGLMIGVRFSVYWFPIHQCLNFLLKAHMTSFQY